MAVWQHARDDESLAVYGFTCDLAKIEPPPAQLLRLLGAVSTNPNALPSRGLLPALPRGRRGARAAQRGGRGTLCRRRILLPGSSTTSPVRAPARRLRQPSLRGDWFSGSRRRAPGAAPVTTSATHSRAAPTDQRSLGRARNGSPPARSWAKRRRQHQLAFYMGCCANRGKGQLSRGECARIGKRALRRAPAAACCDRRRRKRGVLRAWD